MVEDNMPQEPVQKFEKAKCSEGIIRNTLRSFCTSFAVGIALTLSIIATILIIFAFLNTASETKYTTLEVLPNHNWEVKPFSKETDTLLKISINGPIGIGPGIRKGQLYDIIADLHDMDLKPGSLKGIILAINTPGGAVDDSDYILRLLSETKKELNVPIYAYVDNECCSGGMLIALASDTITATSPSVIGSVGVIMGTAFNYSSTMQRLGIESLTLHAGKSKDELNPFRPWTPDEGSKYQTLLDSYYNRFVSLVSEHRPKLTQEKLKEIGAQVFDAKTALELGYIDEINDSWNDFMRTVAQKTGCSDRYQVIELSPIISLSEIITGSSEVMRKGELHHYVRIPGDLHPEAVGKPLYYRMN